MVRGRRSRRDGSRSLLGCVAVLLVSSAVAACSVASLSPSPGASSAATLGQAGWQTPSLAGPSGTPLGSGSGNLGSPPLPTGPLPNLGPAPAGPWTGIDWIAVPTGHAPGVSGSVESQSGPEVTLEGWSKGYVEFIWDPHLRTITPWASADGLTWHGGPKIDTSVWTAEFTTYDRQHTDPGDHDSCSFQVVEFEEGPAVTLLRGFFSCGGGCGGPWYTSSEAMWVSSDASSWTPVEVAKNFGSGSVGAISGGSSGFIALGSSGSSRTLWLSSDGRTWAHGTLPGDLLKTGSAAGAPASFANGYVLPGIVTVQAGEELPGGGMAGCVIGSGPDKPPTYRGGLWWSADGHTWVRDSLSGTTDAAYVDMAVTRIDDHTLLATQRSYATEGSGAIPAEAEWISTDGKTWIAIKGLANQWPLVITDGSRGILRDCTGATGANPWYSLCVIGPKLDMVPLSQTGAVPAVQDAQIVLGPTGLLVTVDGSRFWIGIPTTG